MQSYYTYGDTATQVAPAIATGRYDMNYGTGQAPAMAQGGVPAGTMASGWSMGGGGGGGGAAMGAGASMDGGMTQAGASMVMSGITGFGDALAKKDLADARPMNYGVADLPEGFQPTLTNNQTTPLLANRRVYG